MSTRAHILSPKPGPGTTGPFAERGSGGPRSPEEPGTPGPSPGGGPSVLRRVGSALLRLALLLAGLVFMLAALVAASILAVGLLAWALLRGRRPAPGVFQAYYQRARRRQRPGSEPLVVDVEAVEVVENAQGRPVP